MAGIQSLRVVVVGDPAIGKLSLATRLKCDYFSTEPYQTRHEVLSVNRIYKGTSYEIGLWSTAGHDEYDQLRPLTYVGTDLFVVCFSASSPDSFDHVRSKWIPEIAHHAPGTPFILICTRIDLREDDATVKKLQDKHGRGCITTGEGSDLAQEVGALHYFETSALKREGFDTLAESVIQSHLDAREGQNDRKAACNLL